MHVLDFVEKISPINTHVRLPTGSEKTGGYPPYFATLKDLGRANCIQE